MRILVCNDDGIDAPGLALLAVLARELSPDVWIVAPERKWTAASHHVSFDRDLVLTRVAERTYACSGTPVDCVVAAMGILFASHATPDLVLAGINDKRNVGEDLAYSGTFGIAREATFQGIAAIALAHERRDEYSARERAFLLRLLESLWTTRTQWASAGCWLSVNLPLALPAAIALPTPARDKIAGECDVVEAGDERIVCRIRRGRPGTIVPGDENDAIARGQIAIVRHCWQAAGEVPAATREAWQRAVQGGA